MAHFHGFLYTVLFWDLVLVSLIPCVSGSYSQCRGATGFFFFRFFKLIGCSEFYLSVHFIALEALGEEVWVCKIITLKLLVLFPDYFL